MNSIIRRVLLSSREVRPEYSGLHGHVRRRPSSVLLQHEISILPFSTAASNPAHPRAGGRPQQSFRTRRPQNNNRNNNRRRYSREEKNTVDFTNNLKKLVSSGESKSLEEADKRLRYHLRYWHGNKSLARPNEYSFGVVLGAYSKARYTPGSAAKADELLKLMLDTYEMQEEQTTRDGSSNNVWLVPSSFCTSAAISAWSKNTNILLDRVTIDPIQRASAIVERIELLHERYGRPQTNPNEAVYNALIAVCAFVNNGKGAGRQLSVEQRIANANYAESILNKMEERHREGDTSSRPNVRTYGSLIQTWSGASSLSAPGAADRVEQILHHMEEMYARTGSVDIRPNFFCYTNAIHCWGRSERPDAPAKALAIVEHMERLSDSGENSEARPNGYAYCAVINALAKARRSGLAGSSLSGKEVGEKTDELLRRMKERGVPIVRAANNAAINAWARSNDPRASTRAEEIVAEMERSTNPRGMPDVVTYGTLINVYTKANDPNAPEKAEKVLRKVEQSYLDGTTDRKPQVLTYSAVLQAWAKSGRPDAAQQAEKIIDAMSQTKMGVQGRSLMMQPTSVCYDALIQALARSDEEHALQRIEETLRYMEEQASAGNASIAPTTRTFQGAILGLSKRASPSGGAAKAEKLLRRMIELHRIGDQNVRPNSFVYSACINTFASLNSKEGAAKAYELLREMLIAYNESGDRAMRPTQVTWSAVIHAFANSNEQGSAETASNLLHKMIALSSLEAYAGVTPNNVVFNSVIRAYAHTSDIDPAVAAEKAESILAEMYKLSQSGQGDARPDAFTYATVISSHARAGNIDRSEELLREMQDLYEKGDKTMKSNVVPYTACIQACANSPNAEAAISKADALFDEMRTLSEHGDFDIKPNGGTCSAMLDLYCKTGDEANLAKAEALLERMVDEYTAGDETLKPGQRAFSTVLDALVASGDHDAIERVKRLKERVQDVTRHMR